MDPSAISSLQNKQLSEEDVSYIYTGLYKLLQTALRLPQHSLKQEVSFFLHRSLQTTANANSTMHAKAGLKIFLAVPQNFSFKGRHQNFGESPYLYNVMIELLTPSPLYLYSRISLLSLILHPIHNQGSKSSVLRLISDFFPNSQDHS